MKKIGTLTGSLRKDSMSQKYVDAIGAFLKDKYEIVKIDLSEVELYNQDLEDAGQPAEAWVKMREAVKSVDAILFVTAEYNRGLPPVLSNAIDVGTRPFGNNLWSEKPAAVVSIGAGNISGFGAYHQLMSKLSFLNTRTMTSPEACIGNIFALLDDQGNINEKTQDFLKIIAKSFDQWIESH